jgi:aerobic carbon-monoxide dehydrogenase small subunit
MKTNISIKVNGKEYKKEVKNNLTLLKFLREELKLTGTKEGCGIGECGACTVIVDSLPINSCLMLVVEAAGKEVITIEYLAQTGEFDKIQKSYLKHNAVQCGFCTPGFIMATKALYDKKKKPNDNDIKLAMSGHLCRCTGYKSIHKAIANVQNS